MPPKPSLSLKQIHESGIIPKTDGKAADACTYHDSKKALTAASRTIAKVMQILQVCMYASVYGAILYLAVTLVGATSSVVSVVSSTLHSAATYASYLGIGTICMHMGNGMFPMAQAIYNMLRPAAPLALSMAPTASALLPLQVDQLLLAVCGAFVSIWGCCCGKP